MANVLCLMRDCEQPSCPIGHPYSTLAQRIVYGNDIDNKYYLYQAEVMAQGGIPSEFRWWLEKWGMK